MCCVIGQTRCMYLHSDCARRVQALTYAIEQSCINKARIVALDERESGVRATLNLGHTFGHAMETWQGYGMCLLKHRS